MAFAVPMSVELFLVILIGFTSIALFLFGITSIAVGSFFFLRFVRSYLRGGRFLAGRKKAVAAVQAANLGWLAVACGPSVALVVALISLPIGAIIEHMTLREIIYETISGLFLMTGLGVVAGIIAGGAFWLSSTLLGRVRKAAKRWGGAWDPDLDGLP